MADFIGDTDEDGSIDEYIVFTRFVSMVPGARGHPVAPRVVRAPSRRRRRICSRCTTSSGTGQVLDALLPKYVNARLFNCLQAAASNSLPASGR